MPFRILLCILVPLIILFAGLAVAYNWALPLLAGAIIIGCIAGWMDENDTHHDL